MAQLGHEWSNVKIPYSWGADIDFLKCSKCGYLFQAKTTLPEETMTFLEIPTCGEQQIKFVCNA